MKEEQFETGRGKMEKEFIPPTMGRAWGMLQILELGCYPDFETQTVTAGVLYNSMFVCARLCPQCECIFPHNFFVVSGISFSFFFSAFDVIRLHMQRTYEQTPSSIPSAIEGCYLIHIIIRGHCNMLICNMSNA